MTTMDVVWFTSSSIYVTGGIISLIIITLTTILYCLCHVSKQVSPNRTKLYGRIHETTHRAGPLRRKTTRIDPFMATGLDIVRRFEDSLAMYLYTIFNEVALSRIEDYPIKFPKGDAANLTPRDKQYSQDYKWLITHLRDNARMYTYLFMEVRDRKVQDAVFTYKATPIPVSQLLPGLKGSSRPHKVDTVYSVSHHLREVTKELLMEHSERGCGSQIREGFDTFNKDIREKVRNTTVGMMERGRLVADILHSIVPSNAQSGTIKDKYSEVLRIHAMLVQEYLPYSDLVLQNKKSFQEMLPTARQEAIEAAMEDITTHAHNEEVWEVLAVTVLPRFRKTLANYDS